MSSCKLVLLAINERDNYFVIKATELINFKINQTRMPPLIFVFSDKKSVADIVGYKN